MKKILSDLAVTLNTEGFFTEEIPATAEVPVDQLLVQLDPHQLNWDLHLELAFIGDLDKRTPKEKSSEKTDYLQFFVPLPVQCPAEKAGEMARLVALTNNALPMVGFGYAENQGWIFFRHLMVSVDSEVNHQAVLETIIMMEYLLETFGKCFSDLATGEKTLAQIVSDDVQWA